MLLQNVQQMYLEVSNTFAYFVLDALVKEIQ